MEIPLTHATIGLFHLHPNEHSGDETFGRARFAFVAAQHSEGHVNITYFALPSDLVDANDAGIGNVEGMWKHVQGVSIGTGWNQFEPK